MWLPVILVIVIVIEAVLVLKWNISTRVLIYYMELKKYTQPNAAEIEVCTNYVVRQMFKA